MMNDDDEDNADGCLHAAGATMAEAMAAATQAAATSLRGPIIENMRLAGLMVRETDDDGGVTCYQWNNTGVATPTSALCNSQDRGGRHAAAICLHPAIAMQQLSPQLEQQSDALDGALQQSQPLLNQLQGGALC
jgi:hypothetical protein